MLDEVRTVNSVLIFYLPRLELKLRDSGMINVMKIVTAGSAYMDIDAYAGCIAQAELLRLGGEDAYAASSAPLNESIPRSLRALEVSLEDYKQSENDEFIVVDVSKEDFFDPIVKNGEVIEVIDHHPGQEEYWQNKIGDKADIEFIGASCTQIFERWQANNRLQEMRPEIARLLAAGILDNTLNFNANITTQRDRDAYKALMQIGSLPEDFAAQYFTECQHSIEQNFEEAVMNDIKTMDEAPKLPRTLGQLTVWDARAIALDKKEMIAQILHSRDSDWALNLISISEGRSYFLSNSESGKAKLNSLLDLDFTQDAAEADRLWLRKELLNLALSRL